MTSKYAAVHGSPKDENLEGILSGKVALVTGCSSGIRIETARALFATGATPFLAARDPAKAKTAIPELVAPERVHLLTSISTPSPASAPAPTSSSQSNTQNIFVANAGIMACPESRTADGLETQLRTNHLAHFLLFNLLQRALLTCSTASLRSRGIFVSSLRHRIAEPNFTTLNSPTAPTTNEPPTDKAKQPESGPRTNKPALW